MMKKMLKLKVKVMIATLSFLWTVAVGKKIGEMVEQDNTIKDSQKPIIALTSSGLMGFITGYITMRIIKHI